MEFIITIICTLIFIYGIIQNKREKKRHFIVASFLIGMILFQLIFNGPRWQLYCLYAYSLVMSIQLIYNYQRKNENRIIKRVLFGFYIVMLFISLVLMIVFPYHQIPKPTGDFPVGTFSFDITDPERVELYGETSGELRKIRVQIWYPAEEIKGHKKEKWFADGKIVPRGIPGFTGMPAFLLEYTAKIDSNSYKYAPFIIGSEKYPLVILSHGWFGSRNLHTDIAELLASHGYFVISIDHTYGSLATVFDDGDIRVLDPNALPEVKTAEEFQKNANLLVKTYSLDSKLLIDTLEKIDRNIATETSLKISGITQKMDLNSIGLLGHSTGGGGVTRLAMTDNRIKAIFGLDPWVEPIELELLQKGLKTPSLFISSEEWKTGKNKDFLKIIAKNPETVTKMYQLNGTSHQDFAMIYMLEPVPQIMGLAGKLKSERSQEIQQDFILKFFDQTLKKRENNLDELIDDYDEMIPDF